MNGCGVAYAQWQQATRTLVGGPGELRDLQDRRYRYAARIGRLLTQAGDDGRPVHGPVVYGVISARPGLLYIGQTTEAQRRLRDLAVGESHHLANTVPPEVWDRIIVVRWPNLVHHLGEDDRNAVERLPGVTVGEGLERLLQAELSPVLNSRRRTADGGWRQRQHAGSRSRGAVAEQVVIPLHQLVLPLWNRLSKLPVLGSHHYEAAGRVVLPTHLLDTGPGASQS